MSAFIVDRNHVRFLIEAATSPHLDTMQGAGAFVFYHGDERVEVSRLDHAQPGQMTKAEAGQMLWDENMRSVGTRYGETDPTEMPGSVGESYRYDEHPPAFFWKGPDPVAVLKACDCFAYQSCETPDWSETKAYAFLDALRKRAIRALPGYEDAPWGAPTMPEAVPA